MIISKIVCNRCGVEIVGDAHPPLIVKRLWVKSDKATVSSGYRDKEKIHLCDNCNQKFEEFIQNVR